MAGASFPPRVLDFFLGEVSPNTRDVICNKTNKSCSLKFKYYSCIDPLKHLVENVLDRAKVTNTKMISLVSQEFTEFLTVAVRYKFPWIEKTLNSDFFTPGLFKSI